MRKLASIRRIGTVTKHFNADSLDVVTVDGWQCVTNLGEFKADDLCVFFEVGAFLPVREEFEFLRKSSFRDHPELGPGFRIKTCKLRSELSQGLAMPLHKLPEIGDFIRANTNLSPPIIGNDHEPMTAIESLIERESNDVTEILGVKKYEVPERSSGGVNCGRSRSTFPEFIQKTDQERIQNLFNKYSSIYKHDEWEVTMKLDGSSMTVYYRQDGQGEGKEVHTRGICSRNMDLIVRPDGEPAGDFVNFSNETGLLDRLTKYCGMNNRDLALQGELMGPRIQKNREQFEQHNFYLFDVFDIETQAYLDAAERQDVFFAITDHSRIRHTPVINPAMAVFEEFGNVQDLLDFVDKESINHKIVEGYVFKNLSKPWISFKVINNRFLLKCDTED